MFPSLYLFTAAPNSDLDFRLLQLKPCPMKTIYKFTPEVPVVEQKYDWGEEGGAGVRGCKAADYPREAKEKGRGKTGRRCFDCRRIAIKNRHKSNSKGHQFSETEELHLTSSLLHIFAYLHR